MFGRRQKLKYDLVESKGDEGIELVEPVKRRHFNGACVWSSFGTVLLISIYFVPSVGLTFYQRWLFQVIFFLSKHHCVHNRLIFIVIGFSLSINNSINSHDNKIFIGVCDKIDPFF